jgi:hypothetical protein
MGGVIVTSSASHSRIAQARAWLEARRPAEEILVLAANPDAAKDLLRTVPWKKVLRLAGTVSACPNSLRF